MKVRIGNIPGTQPRAALVTGGSGGIGACVIERIAAAGIAVINIDRVEQPSGMPSRYVYADLTDEPATSHTLAEIVAQQPIGWLVNNAGVALPASLEETRMEDFERVIAVNLRAAILCAQAVLPGMRAAGHGRIVNITSRAALGKELRTAYSAAKAALIGLTRSWALELAPYGITVNAVGPGPIETELFRSANPPGSPRTAAILAGIPLKRMGQPGDVAHAIEFFLSDDASYVTGQTLFVCGGLSVGPAA
jgi:3-oxoacyl-[acyl-carrier protein] reductase